jgi:signal peptidase I
MLKFPRLPAIVNNLIMIVLGFILLMIWIAFAPTQVGGRSYYVMITGQSMQPGFYQGDLAIVRPAVIYNKGDIVTYIDPETRAKIIHRIIGFEKGRFDLKGDNNSWIDPLHPTQDEILGKLWLHLPKLGLVVNWLRLPVNMALIVGILGGVLMLDQKKQPNQHGKQKNKPSGGSSSTGLLEMSLYILGFFTLVFLALTIFAFTRPATRTADDIEFEQTGIFYYSATSPVGIFDTEIIHSGEPIFTQLTCSIIIGFSYNVTGPLQDVSGTQQLIAQITDSQSGWGRTIPLTAATTFNGTSYSTTAPVDLCQFQSLVETVGNETGFQPNVYSLVITSKMAVAAKAGGENVYDSFDSDLVFQFDKVHFYLIRNGEADPLQSSKIGTITNKNTVANTIPVLDYKLNVTGLRTLGIGGFSLSLLGLLILGVYIFQAAQRSQETAIRIRYGNMLMEVYDRGFENISSVIEVTSIDDLAKLAERQNAMILHMTRDFLHYYFVQSDGATYRYVNKENHGRQTNHAARHEAAPAIPTTPPPSEVDQIWEEDDSIQNVEINNEYLQPNFIPKKVTIAYDGPLPYNDQDESV